MRVRLSEGWVEGPRVEGLRVEGSPLAESLELQEGGLRVLPLARSQHRPLHSFVPALTSVSLFSVPRSRTGPLRDRAREGTTLRPRRPPQVRGRKGKGGLGAL